MTTEREALAELVRMFDSGEGTIVAKTAGHVAFAAARAVLAQPEPVAWMNEHGTPVSQSIVDEMDDAERLQYHIPLYAAPPAQAQPLSNDD